MATVSLGSHGISLDVDRGLTSGKNVKSLQIVYNCLVMKPVKYSMKIVEQSKERAFSSTSMIIQVNSHILLYIFCPLLVMFTGFVFVNYRKLNLVSGVAREAH